MEENRQDRSLQDEIKVNPDAEELDGVVKSGSEKNRKKQRKSNV